MGSNNSMHAEERTAGDMHAFTDSLMETGDSRASGSWSTLPDPALMKIFSLLSREDRLFAGSTCSAWWRISHSAQFWRQLSIDMASESALDKATKIVRFHGRHIHDLAIDAGRYSGGKSVKVQRQMTLLLRFLKLRQSSLTKLRIRNFRLDQYWGFGAMRVRLANSLIGFIRKQNSLQNVDLSQNGLERNRGLTLLQTLSDASGHSLEKLNITDLFHGMLSDDTVDIFANVLKNFRCLSALSTNYDCISNSFVEKLTESNKSLKNLAIRVRCNDSLVNRVHSETWRNLKNSHPELRVNFEFVGLHDCDLIKPILVSDIPLRGLEICSKQRVLNGFRVPALLKYIAESFETTLVECTLEFDNLTSIIDNALEQIVRRCYELQSLKVIAPVSLTFVANVCELRRRKAVSLQQLHVAFNGASKTTLSELTRIREYYIAMINEEKLDYAFHTDK